MHPIDLTIIAVYLAIVLGIGVWTGRKQTGTADYFLGRHQIPWWAVMMSIVATETSALTVISVPGIGARGNLTFLQLPIGYVVGRIGVALWLLPGYFSGTQETAYARLESRFGGTTRRVASAVFMTVRALGDSVRVFATAIPLTIVTGWSVPTSVLVMSVVILVYSLAGGLKAVVWVDVLQLGIYLVGGILAMKAAIVFAGGWDVVWAHAATDNKLQVFDWHLNFTQTYTFWGGLLGGALLSAASHGTDHLIVQRLLASSGLRDARKALVWSGIVVVAQFALFLFLGICIWAAGAADPSIPGDRIFPQFVVNYLPPGLAGLIVAGFLAAAMSSSLNALASASTHDFYVPLTGVTDERRLLAFGRWATVGWAVVLALGALLFRNNDQPVVVLALSIASITYGALLGTYILSGVPGAKQRDAIIAIVASTVVMSVIVLAKPWLFARLAWPWYVPMGTAVAVTVGWLGSLVGPAARRTGGP